MTAENKFKAHAGTKPITGGDATLAYRMLPQNLEAEQGLLGALLVKNTALETVSDFLRPYHFFVPAHQRIYEAIMRLSDSGRDAGPVSLKNYFERDDDLKHVGGAEYLIDLAASVITVVNAADYGRTIYDLYLRRELIALCEEAQSSAYELNFDRDAMGLMEAIEGKLFRLAETGETGSGITTLYDALTRAMESAERAYQHDGGITGVTTGLKALDARLGGFQPSDLIILAGRPGMGKTALATTIGVNAARAFTKSGGSAGAGVGFFSLEMSDEQLGQRVLAEQSGVSSDAMRKGKMAAADFHDFTKITQGHTDVPFYIEASSNLSIDAVRTRARRMKRQHGIGLVIIDYLQLLRGADTHQGRQNRTIEVSEITRGLKSIAKDLNIPVLALSQLSREVEKREDKRPHLADLRESGSIEQDADAVCFIYREAYYLAREEPQQRGEESDSAFLDRHRAWEDRLSATAHLTEVITAKQRMGPIGVDKLHFEPELTRFTDV